MTSNSVKPEATGRMTFTGRRYPDGQTMAVWVEDGHVIGDEPIQTLDWGGDSQRWIVPGFFDLQVTGFAGRSLSDPQVSEEDIRHVAHALLRTGVTRFLPTLVMASLDLMCRQLDVIAGAIEHDPLVRTMCPGIHVQGPFIHPDDGPRGAHPREHVRDPSVEDYQRLAAAARGRIAMLTLAPDRPGSIDLIRHVSSQGVVAALGHHRATAEVLEAAVAAGARICTHLGNGSDAVLPWHPNDTWDQLADDRLWAGFIADGPSTRRAGVARGPQAGRIRVHRRVQGGHHLPPAVLRRMIRARTPRRSVLITDAGSAADMPTAIGRAVVDGGVSLLEAVAMASVRPAMLMSDRTAPRHAGRASPADRRPDASASTGASRAGPWRCFAGAEANMVEMEWHAATGSITIRQVAAGTFTAR